MKISKVVKKTIKELQPESLSCNCCGKTVLDKDIDFSDITEININFGYGSKHDTDRWTVDLCDVCIDAWVGTFKFPPSINQY